MELSNTDRIGCSLRAIADSVDLLYTTFKHVYACQGRTFEITTEGLGGKVLKFLLDLLEEKTKG